MKRYEYIGIAKVGSYTVVRNEICGNERTKKVEWLQRDGQWINKKRISLEKQQRNDFYHFNNEKKLFFFSLFLVIS